MYQRISWPSILMGAILLGLPIGCSKQPTSSKTQINMAWERSPRTADPRFALDANSQYLEDLIHCSLFAPDQQGLIKPQLASSWKWVNDRKLLVKIRENAHFADGNRVKVEDVASTFNFFLQTKIFSPRAGHFKSVEKIEVQPPNIIIFHLKAPDAGFIINLTLGILPAKWAVGNRIQFTSSVKGCGPYFIESFKLSSILLKPNTFGPPLSPPARHKVEIHFVRDEITRFSKLRKGELDIVQNTLSYDKISLITKKYPQLKMQRQKGLKIAYMGFNFKNPYLKNPKVRKAIALSIHRSEIIKYILRGFASPATTILLPSSPYYNSGLVQVPYDANQANQILDQAGFIRAKKTGFRFSLNFKTTTNETRISVARAIAANLAKVGIEVKIQSLEWGKFKADVEKGLVDLWTLHWIGFKDPNIYQYIFGSENFPPQGGNRGFYSNAKLDLLLERGRRATDDQLRKKIFWQAQKIISDDLPYVFLWHEDQMAILNQSITNFEVYADGRYSALQKISKSNSH